MRARLFASLSASYAAVLLIAACGGGKPSTEGPKTPAPSGGDTTASTDSSSSSGGTSAVTDAGPTTTTNLTLGSGDLQGAKLTTSGSTTIETSTAAGPRGGPHSPEPGRGSKDVQAIIVSRRDEARDCYDKALKTHPGIEGDLDIRWTIDPKGNVTDIDVDTSKSQIAEPSVTKCIMAIIKKIKFNESAKGFESHAHYPFNFHPRSGGVMVVRGDAGS